MSTPQYCCILAANFVCCFLYRACVCLAHLFVVRVLCAAACVKVEEVPVDGGSAGGYSVGTLDKPTTRLSQYARGKTGSMNPFTPGGEVLESSFENSWKRKMCTVNLVRFVAAEKRTPCGTAAAAPAVP